MGEPDCTVSATLCTYDIEGDDNDIDGADLSVLAAEFGREDCLKNKECKSVEYFLTIFLTCRNKKSILSFGLHRKR